MPSLPEFDDSRRLIRRIEIDGQFDMQHMADPLSHIAITRKIKIKLKRIQHGNNDRVRGIQYLYGAKSPVHRPSQQIRQENFFRQPHRKEQDSLCKQVCIRPFSLRRAKLFHHLPVRHNGTCDQLGKKYDKQRILDEPALCRLLLIGICQKGYLLEGKKTDAQRQHDIPEQKRSAENRVDIFRKEVKIFKIA